MHTWHTTGQRPLAVLLRTLCTFLTSSLLKFLGFSATTTCVLLQGPKMPKLQLPYRQHNVFPQDFLILDWIHLSSTHYSFPVPEEKKEPQNITEPLPCFTVGKVFFSECDSFFPSGDIILLLPHPHSVATVPVVHLMQLMKLSITVLLSGILTKSRTLCWIWRICF